MTLRLSLRVLLLASAGLIAALAVAAATLTVWSNVRSARLLAEAAGAQARIELLARLSARVGEYGLIAVDTAAGFGSAEHADRLEARAEAVRAGLDAVSAALSDAVAAATSDTARTAVASRSIGIARMGATFETLARALPAEPAAVRARLDSFATLFAPLLDDAIEAERRTARAAELALERQRRLMQALAVAIVSGAALMLAAYYLGLVRPLLGRLGRVARTAEAIGSGAFGRTPVDRRDELGLVFVKINRMAARLGRARATLERDRARLEATVAERTAALTAANARLEAVDAERRRLYADVGHELRTPLTVILAETELAARPGAVGEAELRAALEVIGARGRRLNRRIDDLLRVARSESGQIDLEALPFDAALAAREALEDIRPLARRAGVELVPRLGPAPPALGDRDWTRQVIAGVVENAIRHSPPGAVEVALAADDDKLVITVTDAGEGVAEADRERIFDRHERGTRRGLGFGVGLALARWVMTRQGGTIALASPVDPTAAAPGSRVTLVLRRASPEEGA